MAKYKEGDKVITTDEWNNGMGRIIPKGRSVNIISVGGKIEGKQLYNCIYNGQSVLYEENWLGEKINTNADRIHSMSIEELAEFLDVVEQIGIQSQYSGVPCDCCTEKTKCDSCWKEWLQSEVEG